MISYWIRRSGTTTELERREVETPVPKPGEMLVRMVAASLNRGDLMGRTRRHSADSARPAGADGAGIVEEPGESEFRAGELVMFRAHGVFAEYATVDPGLAHRVPPTLTPEQAAGVPSGFVTAWEGLIQHGHAKAGDWVLICGASSGVGVAAVQLARHFGCKVIGTSGAPQKLAALAALGADVVIRSLGSGFVDEVMRVTAGRGVDVSLNLVGGSAFPGCVSVAADFGRSVFIGYVDGQMRAEIDLEAVHARRLVLSGLSNAPLSPTQRAAADRGFARDVLPALASGAIVPLVDRVFPFDRLPEAKTHVESDQQVGKVVIRFS